MTRPAVVREALNGHAVPIVPAPPGPGIAIPGRATRQLSATGIAGTGRRIQSPPGSARRPFQECSECPRSARRRASAGSKALLSKAGGRMQGRPRPRASGRSRVPRESGDAELPAGLSLLSPDRPASLLVLPAAGSDRPCLQPGSAGPPHDRRRGSRQPANRVSRHRFAF